jgi:hypothetical protein
MVGNIGSRNSEKYWIHKWWEILDPILLDPEMAVNIGLRNGGKY